MDADDEVLLDELAHALAERTEAADIARVGREVWAWRSPDVALAELISDTADSPLAGVRSAGGPRLLRFEAQQVTLEVESVDGHLRGLVIGQGTASIEAQVPGGAPVASADLDPTGWFDLIVPAELSGAGALLRLRVIAADGGSTWTAWFRL